LDEIPANTETEDGQRLAHEMGFKDIRRGQGPLGDDRLALALNLAKGTAQSRLIRAYQLALKNRTRRAK
jgi:hypothetical protein